MKKRVLLIVLDSLGVGALPDAAAYDVNYQQIPANTLLHIAQKQKMHLPCLQGLGFCNIQPLPELASVDSPKAAWGKMAMVSHGKDTTTGHWEIAGLVTKHAMPLFPNGFPKEVIDAFCAATGRGVLGNCVASGVAIINELGKEHMKSGDLIVYTSADSVFQIAAHEDIVPIEELYVICLKARGILTGKYGVGRVIARPFIGLPGNFMRTENRKDFSLSPPQGGLTQSVSESGLDVISVGKISDIFAGVGITKAFEGHNNEQSIASTHKAMDFCRSGLIFANLVDFDMLYGHRNDVAGYARAIEAFDAALPSILDKLQPDDMFCVTADHGNDPVVPDTDHTREYVPLLICGKKIKPVDLGIRKTFADLGQTIADYLEVKPVPYGMSMLKELL